MRCRQQEMEKQFRWAARQTSPGLLVRLRRAQFSCRWEHGELRVCVSRLGVEEPPAKIVFHQCGYRGCRIGEASNPGPVQTRQARRLETALDSARHPGPTSRRRRRRASPWSWDSDTESDTDPRLSCGGAVGTQVDSSDVPSELLDAMERDCEASHSRPTMPT